MVLSRRAGHQSISRPRLHSIISAISLALPLLFTASLVSAAEPALLSLNQAIGKAVALSPRLASAEAGIDAARGERQQAALYPNPELSGTVEDVLGSGPYEDFDQAESAIGLMQPLELGGKRSARRAVAAASEELSVLEAVSVRRDLERDVVTTYALAAAAAERQKLAQRKLATAEETLRAVQGRVEAGREAQLQQEKANVALTSARIARNRADSELMTAKRALSMLWAGEESNFTLDTAWFRTLGDKPLAPEDADGLSQSRLRAEERRSHAQLAAAKADAFPDVGVSAAAKRFPDDDDTAYTFGLSVPLPLFNRNQGNIARARAELRRTEMDNRDRVIARKAALSAAYEQYRTAWEEAGTLVRDVVPAAVTALTKTREGYQGSKFSYLEVLDAQRTLFDAEEQLIASLARLHESRAAFDRLRGASRLIDSPSPPSAAQAAPVKDLR